MDKVRWWLGVGFALLSALAGPAPRAQPADPAAAAAVAPRAHGGGLAAATTALRSGNYAGAYIELIELANEGDAQAQYFLGWMTDNGLGPTHLDPAAAFRWYKLAAEQGHNEAQFAVARALGIGRGTSRNMAEAMVWLRRSADAGQAPAMMALAVMLDEGRGVARDPEAALAWERRAADAGDGAALYSYADRLFGGRGLTKNADAGMEWLRRAVATGYPPALYRLSKFILERAKRAEDRINGYVYLTLVVQLADGELRKAAQTDRASLQSGMSPDEVADGTKRAGEWKAVDAKSGPAGGSGSSPKTAAAPGAGVKPKAGATTKR